MKNENIYSTSKNSHHTNASANIANSLVATDYKDAPTIFWENKMKVVRRLTPLECERLQGYPDNWTDIGEWEDSKGKKRETADSARYKALGNSIALPFWQRLAIRISSVYDRDITIASLFDGIGGFPYCFERCGNKAVWASEIEEFPIAVTKKRFPNMKHYGDITKINGAEVEPVDVIVGGSPCQDLSVAGKRAGLAGERSGLFMEQMRIVREMREHDRELHGRGADEPIQKCRWLVWENVAGAYSSGQPKGADFAAVLEEVLKVCNKDAHVDVPHKGWPHSGCIVDEGGRFSVAWRLHDAQFWGVPQRRKRICLVADFGGQAAPEVLFERASLSRNTDESIEKGQGTADDSKGSPRGANYTLKIRGGVSTDSNGRGAGKGALIQTELSGTLGVSQDQTLFAEENPNGIKCLTSWDTQTRRVYDSQGVYPSLTAGAETSGQNQQTILENKNGINRTE